MKRYIKTGISKKGFVDYVVIINLHMDDLVDLAAGRRISEPPRPTNEHIPFTEEQLIQYNDAVDTIINAIGDQGFELQASSHQSQESYSYYAISKLKDFPQYGKFTMIFRISQHDDKHHDSDSPMVRNAIIRTIDVEIGSMASEYRAQQQVQKYSDEFKSLVKQVSESEPVESSLELRVEDSSKIYSDGEFEVTVWEVSRKEALNYAKECVESWYDGVSGDGSVYIEYDDGSYFYADETENINLANFKKQHIKTIIIDDGSGYTIYGPYELDDNLIPQVK